MSKLPTFDGANSNALLAKQQFEIIRTKRKKPGSPSF
jgi:hypothetical protein